MIIVVKTTIYYKNQINGQYKMDEKDIKDIYHQAKCKNHQ